VVTRERIASFRNPWFTASVGITAAIALVAAVVGFVWLPLAHPGEQFKGAFRTRLPVVKLSAPTI
jgi:hypothetical protein